LQGVTEFLPVSSSGHLAVYQQLMGLQTNPVLFDVMVHLGTLLAILIVFRSDIHKLLIGVFQDLAKNSQTNYESLLLLVLLGISMIPSIILGLGWKHELEELFAAPVYIGCGFLVTGCILWLSQFSMPTSTQSPTKISWIKALIIGVAQALALVPGISRSGTTISIALLMGLDRKLAARYSFLLSIPTIAGVVIGKLIENQGILPYHWLSLIAGTIVAAITGYFALTILLRIVVTGNLSKFSYYCWSLGLLTLVAVLGGAL